MQNSIFHFWCYSDSFGSRCLNFLLKPNGKSCYGPYLLFCQSVLQHIFFVIKFSASVNHRICILYKALYCYTLSLDAFSYPYDFYILLPNKTRVFLIHVLVQWFYMYTQLTSHSYQLLLITGCWYIALSFLKRMCFPTHMTSTSCLPKRKKMNFVYIMMESRGIISELSLKDFLSLSFSVIGL